MSQAHFAKMPNISIPRTKMKIPFTHKTSFLFSKCIPIMAKEILPGDTFRVDVAALIRMSTPIAPIMDNIRGSIHAFFVPMRLLWEHTEEFYGANKTQAGPQGTVYTIPGKNINTSSSDTQVAVGSVSDYLGKPIYGGSALTNTPKVSVLKERAYWLIWSEWYRAQQVQNPVIVSKSDTAYIGDWVHGGVTNTLTFASMPAAVCKPLDYFTAATLSPQYGTAVELPLGSYAPLGVIDVDYFPKSFTGSTKSIYFGSSDKAVTSGNFSALGNTQNDARLYQVEATEYDSEVRTALNNTNFKTNLVADLSQATAATVNTLRYAFAVQKYLERSNFGSRFFEMLNAHYGVSSPDSRLQRPEHLGEIKFNINIQQVLSTAGADTSSSTELGVPGANSTTAVKGHLFRKGFVEPGYVLCILSTYQDHTYGQGVYREDLRQSRYEFYSPEFANLGDMPVYKNEIMLASNQKDAVFGYQEHWAEYRYMPDMATGLLRPTAANALDYWTLADNFGSVPTLSESFIEENRDNIKRALVTGETGPDFIGDFYFDITAVRPMPAYTIPGLIDHFGTR